MNGDGEVSIADVSALIDYLLSEDDTLIVIEKSDIDGDGEISIADVTALIDILLNVGRDLNLVVTGADGLTFGGFGTGPAR